MARLQFNSKAQLDSTATAGELGAGEPYLVTGEVWTAVGTGANSYITHLTALTSNLDIYVATTGNDTNDGLSSSTPFQTIQMAVSAVQSRYALCGHTVTINVADGIYKENIKVSFLTGGILKFSGSTNAVLQCSTGLLFNINHGSCVHILGFTIGGGGTPEGIYVLDWATCVLAGGHIFSNITGFHAAAVRSSSIILSGNYTINGGARNHLGAYDNSSIIFQNITTTLVGTPNLITFIDAGRNGSVQASGAFTYSGGATGIRYNAYAGGNIWTNGKGANFFPGTINGSTASGGVYS